MRRKKLSDMLLQATDGLIGTVVNLVLYELYVVLLLPGKTSSAQLHRTAVDAHELVEELGYDTIKRAMYHLIAQGLIKRLTKEGRTELAITAVGRKKLETSVPQYRPHRPWDGHIYLISYDVPKKANSDRDALRDYIQTTGGALLQESLWINPYNPTRLLAEFAKDHQIPGSILISRLGKDGAIGEEKLPYLLEKVYHLEDLWNRYDAFIKNTRLKTFGNKLRTSLEFLSILRDDPQLPFPLEPADFPAKKAYELFTRICQTPATSAG
ncbi:MAG TPA: PaaX family transcriptional regulator C-terminal domain-containing protein [Patescibacteria group bacterium]|nr:PaaX family transcriptional regulator C-terminal domain-containing protein [Patescibacteria group bacterium]